MSKIIGYARVSSRAGTQSTDSQVSALKEAGADIVYEEKISTRKDEQERPQLQAALKALRSTDTLLCVTLSLIGRTKREVINRLHDLQAEGIHVRTLDGFVNTEAMGKFAPVLIGLLTGLNEVERTLANERSLESIAYRRANNGNLGGRPKTSPKKEKLVVRLREEGESLRGIRDQTGLAVATVRKILERNQTESVVGIK